MATDVMPNENRIKKKRKKKRPEKKSHQIAEPKRIKTIGGAILAEEEATGSSTEHRDYTYKSLGATALGDLRMAGALPTRRNGNHPES